MQRSTILILIAAILIIGFLIFSVSKTQKKTGPESVFIPRTEVTVGENGFSPQTLTIKKGDAVAWVNQGGDAATVNSDPHPTHDLHRFLNLGEFPSESSVEVTFNEVGTFGYHNHFNPSQTGTIVVQ